MAIVREIKKGFIYYLEGEGGEKKFRLISFLLLEEKSWNFNSLMTKFFDIRKN